MTGIIFATEDEAEPFLRQYKNGRFEDLSEGETLFDDDVLLTLTGLGKIKATLRTERFLRDHQPERIIHVGTCTALNDSLRVGQIIAAAQVFEGDRIELAAPTYPRMPLELPFEGLTSGTLVTQDHVARDRAEKSYWQRIADISDMTGYAVAYVSATYGIPCHIVKVVAGLISDDDNQFRKNLAGAHERMGSYLVSKLNEVHATS